MGDTTRYTGAGDGQCLALKASDGNRCTNGVYGNDHCCGTHKKADDVTLAPEADGKRYRHCPECGYQPIRPREGDSPLCSKCGVEYPIGADWFHADNDAVTVSGVEDAHGDCQGGGNICTSCGSFDTVRVWEDPADWKADEPPDFVGCEDCGVVER